MDYLDKAVIRKDILSKRGQLSENELNDYSLKILERLCSLEQYKKANILYLYASYLTEVRTYDLIRRAFEDGKRVAIPVSYIDNYDIPAMKFYEINSASKLKIGYKGIMEPDISDDNTHIMIDEPDLFIIPGVAFDTKRNRIGYGKGFYDRYMASNQLQSPVVALAFECQIYDKIIPADMYDKKPDMIVTEKRIIK